MVVAPTVLELTVSTNRPPKLKSRTWEISSCPSQLQMIQTPSCVATRALRLLKGKTDSCNKGHHRLRAFERMRNAKVRRTSRAGIVPNEGFSKLRALILDLVPASELGNLTWRILS